MTVVAYKDGQIASDSRCQIGEMVCSDKIQKIFKGPNVISGGAGDAADLTNLERWTKAGGDLQKMDDRMYGMAIYKIGPKKYRAIRLEQKHQGWYEVPLVQGEYIVLGSGREVAAGALEAGATVEEAVEIAIKLIPSCGGKVQTLSL